LAHGWWTKEGEKMSKSLGNVVDPIELLNMYGVEYVRYFLASEIYVGNDGDFSHEAFVSKINCELSDDVGNLLQRVLCLVQQHGQGRIAAIEQVQPWLTEADELMLSSIQEVVNGITLQLEQHDLKSLIELILNLARAANRYIDVQVPWTLAKTKQFDRMNAVLYVLAEVLRTTAVCLQPVVPQCSLKMLDQLVIPMEYRSFSSLQQRYPAGQLIRQPTPAFPKLDLAVIQQQQQLSNPNGKSSTSSNSSKHFSQEQSTNKLTEKYASLSVSSKQDWTNCIQEVGQHIRVLKLEKVSKSSLEPFLFELTFLKAK
jgi:methionyl-tRNA synthetase